MREWALDEADPADGGKFRSASAEAEYAEVSLTVQSVYSKTDRDEGRVAYLGVGAAAIYLTRDEVRGLISHLIATVKFHDETFGDEANV